MRALSNTQIFQALAPAAALLLYAALKLAGLGKALEPGLALPLILPFLLAAVIAAVLHA